jgi:CHAT domain-containing protein/tetratricopeptide (TPR) repeat protein
MKWPVAFVVSALLFFLFLFPPACDGAPFPSKTAVIDSLFSWHRQSRPDLVDSLAAVMIPGARAENDSTYLLQLLRHSGSTQAAFGMAKQAEPSLREVCRLARATQDTLSWLEGLRWLSVAVARQGRPAEAVQYYTELGGLARTFGDSLHVGWSELGMAYDHYLNGRSNQAIEGYRQAAGILDRAGMARGALWAYNGQGMALRQEGQFDAAIRSFRHALDMSIVLGDKISEAMALNFIGRLEMLLGDPDVAIDHFERAAAIHQEFQHHREGLLPLLDIAQARTLQGRFDEAARGLETIAGQAEQWGLMDLELLAIQQLVDIHLARNRPGRAVQLCLEAMDREEFPSAMARTEMRLRWAQGLAALGKPDEALAVLEPVSGARSAATTLELRVCRQKARYHLDLHQNDKALECALEGVKQARVVGSDLMLAPLQTLAARSWFAQGKRDSALASINRAANQWERIRALPADPRWRELRSGDAGMLFTQGAVMMMAGNEGPDGAFDLIQRYKARTLVERMLMPGQDLETVADQISLQDLQSGILQPGMVFWEVVTDEGTTVCLLVTHDKVLGHVVVDGGRNLNTMRKLSDVLTSDRVQDPSVARLLAASLFEGFPSEFLQTLAGAQRLIWSPDGFWHGLPLALLRDQAGEGLISAHCEVARIPCASVLKPGPSFAGKNGCESEILVFQGTLPGEDPHLAGTTQEVDWLKSHFQNVRAGSVGDDSPEEDRDWNTEGLIHVASHTKVDDQQPWNTGIYLGNKGDHLLKAADVADLRLQAGLTVLASCRTAGSRTVGGEGMLGLTSAFLASGVPSVVATLWPVDDRATAVFMTRFYTNLADGLDVSSALLMAQAESLEDPAMNATRYWAGFVVVGDGSQMVPLKTKSAGWPRSAALLVLAGGVAWRGRQLGAKKPRRRSD